jgi:6,7-dimethyl-8-ribityllumazine synthase
VRHADSAPAPLTGAGGHRFALIVSRFNESVTNRLRDAARSALAEAGAAEHDIEVIPVPGAFELPQAARCAAETGRFDAIVCLGCLIRGETPHFEYISSAVAHGLMEAAGETGVPMAFGVLTTDSWEQAEARAGSGRDNKGFEAAAAALEMAALFRRLRWSDRPAGSLGGHQGGTRSGEPTGKAGPKPGIQPGLKHRVEPGPEQ